MTNSGYVQSNNYDLKDYDKVTVMIYAERYRSGNTITVATSVDTKTITLTSDSFTWYTFVLNCANSDYVKITASGLPDMRQVKVYAGDASSTAQLMKTATEEGDASKRVITGITDKFYTVNNLTPETTYYFKVKALYADGTESDWSEVKQVTLTDAAQGIRGDVNNDGKVDVQDVNILVNILLGTDQASNYDGRADVDESDTVDVGDINTVINIMLNINSQLFSK